LATTRSILAKERSDAITIAAVRESSILTPRSGAEIGGGGARRNGRVLRHQSRGGILNEEPPLLERAELGERDVSAEQNAVWDERRIGDGDVARLQRRLELLTHMP
jgi:hypothetical protein